MATTGFTRKKVESMTLGEKLKKIRSEYRISLNEVSKNTKIQMKYLEFLENGEYEKLPAEVYVRGFVRSYANFLGTDESTLVKMYERERKIQKNIKKEQFSEQREVAFHFPRFFITPKVFIMTGIAIIVCGGFVYLYREFQSFASVPRLVVIEPSDGQIISDQEIFVRGTTEKDATLMINGQPVLVRDGGEFYERIHLQPGLNAFTVISTNKFKKEKSVTLSVQANYEDAAMPKASGEEAASLDTFSLPVKTSFEVYTKDTALRVSVDVDGTRVYNGILDLNTKKVFDVNKEIKISSEDGSKTFVHRGGSLEANSLSTVSGEVKDVVFTATQ